MKEEENQTPQAYIKNEKTISNQWYVKDAKQNKNMYKKKKLDPENYQHSLAHYRGKRLLANENKKGQSSRK